MPDARIKIHNNHNINVLNIIITLTMDQMTALIWRNCKIFRHKMPLSDARQMTSCSTLNLNKTIWVMQTEMPASSLALCINSRTKHSLEEMRSDREAQKTLISSKMDITIPNMGTTKVSLTDALFKKNASARSRAIPRQSGQRLLRERNRAIFRCRTSMDAMQREREKLAAAGLFSVTKISNQEHCQANCQSPIFEELIG